MLIHLYMMIYRIRHIGGRGVVRTLLLILYLSNKVALLSAEIRRELLVLVVIVNDLVYVLEQIVMRISSIQRD